MHHILHQPTTLQPTGYGSLEWRGLFGNMHKIQQEILKPFSRTMCSDDSITLNPKEAGR
jgi:cation transport regulator ChaC